MVFGTFQYRRKLSLLISMFHQVYTQVLYSSSDIKLSANTIISKQTSKSITHKLPKDSRVFDSLIDSNIYYHIIDKQMKQDARIYTPISIATKNPSLAVIIRKKQTHTDIYQYLHTACYFLVQFTFLKETNNSNLTTWSGLMESLIEKIFLQL